jgi:hypothetical protein
MIDSTLEYNTGRNSLVMPEYGRNIQKMVEYTCTIEDRDERSRSAQAIVNVMGTLNPHLRDITDFKHKLWDHLYIISEYKLDVDAPYPVPAPEALHVKPQPLPYPKNEIRYRHYGKVVENLIEEVIKIADGPEKEVMVRNLANFMKYLYVTYNKDTVVDEVIFENLRKMSRDKINVPENLKLMDAYDFQQMNLRDKNKNNGNGKKKKLIQIMKKKKR